MTETLFEPPLRDEAEAQALVEHGEATADELDRSPVDAAHGVARRRPGGAAARFRRPDARPLPPEHGSTGTHSRRRSASAVISGLPVLSMPPRRVITIPSGAFGRLREGEAFYQFTHGPLCPVPRPILDRPGLKARRTSGALLNVPPASVYKITRRTARRHRAGAGAGRA